MIFKRNPQQFNILNRIFLFYSKCDEIIISIYYIRKYKKVFYLIDN